MLEDLVLLYGAEVWGCPRLLESIERVQMRATRAVVLKVVPGELLNLSNYGSIRGTPQLTAAITTTCPNDILHSSKHVQINKMNHAECSYIMFRQAYKYANTHTILINKIWIHTELSMK